MDQATNKVTLIDSLDSEIVAKELIASYAERIGSPLGTCGTLIRAINRQQIDPDQTMRKAGLHDDETLIADMEMVPGGRIPIRTFRDIQLIEGVLSHSNSIHEADRTQQVLFAVFLYTELDGGLATFVRENLPDLDSMSGHQCMFFVIERPAKEWDQNLRSYLGELAGEYFDALWQRLGTESFKPFDKTTAYSIGERFGVKPSQFPCIVFFVQLASKEVAVVEVNNFVDTDSQNVSAEYARFFRVLFSVTQSIREKPQETWLSEIERRLPQEWKKSTGKQIKPIEKLQLSKSIIETIGAILKIFL